MASGLEVFAKKIKPKSEDFQAVGAIMVPPIFIWFSQFDEHDKPHLVTAAVKWEGLRFGLSFEIDENQVRARMDCDKLIRHMRETSSVLALHGKMVLDSNQELNMKQINEQEAIRFKFDPLWDKRVKVVDSLIKVKYITQEDARKLKVL